MIADNTRAEVAVIHLLKSVARITLPDQYRSEDIRLELQIEYPNTEINYGRKSHSKELLNYGPLGKYIYSVHLTGTFGRRNYSGKRHANNHAQVFIATRYTKYVLSNFWKIIF
jgi:hypothetical protein